MLSEAHRLQKNSAGEPLTSRGVDELLSCLGCELEGLKEAIDLGNMYKREAGKKPSAG